MHTSPRRVLDEHRVAVRVHRAGGMPRVEDELGQREVIWDVRQGPILVHELGRRQAHRQGTSRSGGGGRPGDVSLAQLYAETAFRTPRMASGGVMRLIRADATDSGRKATGRWARGLPSSQPPPTWRRPFSLHPRTERRLGCVIIATLEITRAIHGNREERPEPST